MPQDERTPMRWVETTSRCVAPQAEASTSNNIPSMYSTQEDGSNRAGNLLYAPTAITSFVPAKKSASSDAAFASTSKAAAVATASALSADVCVDEGYAQNSCSDSVNVLKRITATPRKVQTQIAKICYPYVNVEQTFHTTQRPCVPTTTMVGRIHFGTETTTHKPQLSSPQSISSRSNETPPKSSTAEFNKRKNERDQEIREIAKMLNEIQNDTILFKEIGEEANAQNTVEKSASNTTVVNHNAVLKENIPQDNYPIAAEEPQPKPTATTISTTSIAATLDEIKYKLTAPTSILNTEFERSKTDISLLSIKAATTRRNRNQTREKLTTKRSKSTQLPATKSNELLPENMDKRTPAYDREATRRFMEEQRKKRRINAANELTNRSNQTDKEQIKKRLEELKKNSKKIVTKNLKNAQKRTPSPNLIEVSPSKTARLEIVLKRPVDRKNFNRNKMKKPEQTKTETKSSLETQKSEENLPQEDRPAPVPPTEAPPTKALQENQKRIGLLRKPELKDHSFSAIRDFSFDKENVAIEMMTPKIDLLRLKSKLSVASNREDTAVATKTIVEESKNEEHNLNLEMPSARLRPRPSTREITVQVQETPSLMATKFKDTVADEAEPTAPPKPDNIEINANAAEKPTQNVSKEKTTEKLPQAAADEQNERTDALPYWLKPSAVQIYPYNFIMAVRRKLEAITNPMHIQPTTSKNATEDNKHTSTLLDAHKQAETPLTSLSKRRIVDAQHKVKRNLIPAIDENPTEDSFATHTIENNKVLFKESSKRKPSIQQSHKNTLKSQTFSDITSNFSSISLQLPASNTVSEVSSIKSECVLLNTVPKEKSKIVATTSHLAARASEDDDTTVSSSIFNSPEKKLSQNPADFEFVAPRPVSPLSLERIDNLKINTKGKLNEAISSKYVTTGRGGDSLKSRRSKQNVTPLHDTQAEAVSINFNRLLDDFNRSLSQVIEVNEQLKSTLDKSQQICTERINRQNSKSDSKHEADEYSSDFEAASSKLAKIKVNGEENAVKQRAVDMEKRLQQRKKELFHITNEVKPLLSSSQASVKSTTEKNNASNLNLNIESAENSSSNSKRTRTILSAQSFAVSTSHLLEARLSSSPSGDSLDKRLHNIEQLKLNLKQSILSSQENRKKVDNDSKLTSGGANKNRKDKNNMTNEEKNLESKESKIKEADIVPNGNKAILQNPKAKVSKSFSKTSTVEKTDSVKTDESVQRTADASKQTTVATVANSLEATLNQTSSLKQSAPTPKSTNLESKSISEELQYATETPSQDNKNMPHHVSRHYSQNRKSNNNKLDNSSSSSISTPNKTQNDQFIKSHINRDRGDFLSGSDVNDSQSKDISYQAVAATPPPPSGDSIHDSSTDSAAPPSYNALSSKYRTPPAKAIAAGKTETPVGSTTTLGKEIVAIFNQSDLELSILSSQNGSLSETSLNYSSVGLYERLIKNETTKSEHLTTLLKMREKSLIDRTKGQIAWLEVQKERYKAKGLLMHISAIKKKQRGILLKMEREREGIKRLLQSTSTTTSTHSSAQPHTTQYPTSPSRKRFERSSTIPHPSTAPPALLPLPLLPKTARSLSSQQPKLNQQQQIIATTVHSAPIVRAKYDLESNRSLEELLRKRENDLRRRREHVERLMQWHQRLDQEEAEVLQLEHMLLNCNNVHALPHWHDCTTTTKEQTPISKKKQLGQVSSSPVATAIKISEQASQKNQRSTTCEEKMERRLKEIDKSLRELSIMSTSNNSVNATNSNTSDDNSNNIEFVRTTGSKLNKLWRRLTSQQVEKFESNRRYKLCKADLERLYEEAKVAVLRDFAQDEEHRIAVELLDKTTTSFSSSHSQIELANTNKLTIPHLNLNFSSGQSEQEEEDSRVVGEEVMLGESVGKKAGDFTYTLVATQTQQDNYSPSAAEGNFVMHIEEELEEEVSSKPSSTSIPPNSYTSSNSATSFDSGGSDVAAEKVEREELIQRNVQKFLALTQRFNSTQNFDGLERSLSDTQLADNGAGVKKSTKNVANTTQRNIAYYGVKTQKKPSKTVNVEIANTLSSASSIFSANTNTLCYVESLPAQSIAENSVARNYAISSPIPSNQSIEINAHSPSLLSEVVNDIPTQSNTALISIDSVKVELRTAESLTDSAAVFSQTSSETNFQPLTENSLQITYSSSAKTKTVSTAASNSAIKYSNSSATRSLSMPEVSSNVRETPSYTSASKSIFSAQHSNTADVNSTAREISAKLEEISAAVSILSHSNSLQSGANAMTSQSQQQQQQSTNLIPSVFSSPTINVQAENISAAVSSPSYSSNFENIDTEMQSPSGCTLKTSTSIRSNTLVQSSAAENQILNIYETDFEDGDETCIDDLSLPQFETTIETTQEDLDVGGKEESVTLPSPPPPILCEKLAIASPPTKNQVKKSFVDRENLPPPPPPPPPPLPPTSSPLQVIASTSKEAASINNSSQQQPQTPDVINELELRRYQQIQQYEHVTAVPYMYMREIPNKPPPPYVPPAHGSPMTTIFPSEERIKDLTYRRTHELFCKILKTDYTNEKGEKLPSVKEEKITNIYERIILDICREYLNEHVEVLTKSDPITFHSNLAFFNPPDRLRCIQTFVYKEVRRCLAMDKMQPKRKQVYSVYGQRAKRDHIGKIIIQEMYDEDDKWCNFHREENEVLDLIIEEMINKLVTHLSKEVLIEEGGIVEDEEEEDGEEEEIMDENAEQQQKEEETSSLHEEESLQSLCEEIATSLNIATSETSNIGADHFIPSVQSTKKLAEDAPTTTNDLKQEKCMANFKHN